MKNNTLCIVGTDTDVGKTVVTGCFARYFLEQGFNVVTHKIVETGTSGSFSQDIDTHLSIMKRTRGHFRDFLPQMSPYRFPRACSPHLAAHMQKKRFNATVVKKSLQTLNRHFDYTFIEGTGGLCVPLTKTTLFIDMLACLHVPVVLVAANKLGAINHTLLSIEALAHRGIECLGVIYNVTAFGRPRYISKDNPDIISSISRVETLGILDYEKKIDTLYKQFMIIGKRVLEKVETGKYEKNKVKSIPRFN